MEIDKIVVGYKAIDRDDLASSKLEEIVDSILLGMNAKDKKLFVGVEGLSPGSTNKTLAQMGRELELSRERVRQLYKRTQSAIIEIFPSETFNCLRQKIIKEFACYASSLNIYDVAKIMDESYHIKKYNPISVLVMIFNLAGDKKVMCDGVLGLTGVQQYHPRKIWSNENRIDISRWFYGLRRSEISLLDDFYDLGLGRTEILKHTISDYLWRYLDKTGIYTYLQGSMLYGGIKEHFESVIDEVSKIGGTVSRKEILSIFVKYYDCKELNPESVCKLCAKILGGIAYDRKHFLWVAEGHTWNEFYAEKEEHTVDSRTLGKMSQTNAAYAILKRYDTPMRCRDIIEIAIKNDIILTKARNPAGGLNVLLYMETKKDIQLGRKPRFRKLDDGRWELTGHNIGSRKRHSRKRDICESIPKQKKLSYCEVAFQILKEAGTRLHFKEITDRAIAKGYFDKGAKNYYRNMYQALRNAEINNKKKGKSPQILRMPNGYCTISKDNDRGSTSVESSEIQFTKDDGVFEVINKWLCTHSENQRKALERLFGLFDDSLPVNEVAKTSGLAVSTVNLLMSIGPAKLRTITSDTPAGHYLHDIERMLEKNGGIMHREEMARQLPLIMKTGNMQAKGIVSLLAASSDQVSRFGKECYNLVKFTTPVINEVRKRTLAGIKRPKGTPFSELVSDFCMTNYYFDELGEPGEKFIKACIRTNPKIIISKGIVVYRTDLKVSQ